MRSDVLIEFKQKLSFSRITFSHINSKFSLPKWLGLYREVFCLTNRVYFVDAEFLHFDWSGHYIQNGFDQSERGTCVFRCHKAAIDTGSLYFDIGTMPLIRNITSSCIILFDHKTLVDNVLDAHHSKNNEIGKIKETMNCVNLFDLPKWSHVVFCDQFLFD
jgi:hypothetical protein